MKRGEIRWYKFQPPDKKRPVLILTRDAVLEYLGEVVIAPISTTIRDIPSHVILNGSDGMPKNCSILCDHLQTVAKSRIGPLIATLGESKMSEVRKAVMFALDF